MLFSSLGPGCATSAEADELNDASTAGKLDRFTDLKPIIRHLPHAVSTSFRLRFKSQSPGSRRARLRRHRGRHAVDPDTIAGADAGQVIGDGDEGRALSRRPAPYGLGGPRPRAHRKAHRARAQQPRAQQPRAQQRRQPRWTDEPRPRHTAATRLWIRWTSRCAPCPHPHRRNSSDRTLDSRGFWRPEHRAEYTLTEPPGCPKRRSHLSRAGPYPGRHCMVCVRA